MADKKISALTAATTPLDGTEVLPIVQSGATKKVANNDLRPRQIQSNATSGVLQIVGPAAAATRVMTTPDANFTAARTDAANSFSGNQTLSDGNLVVGTAGKGIDFSANANAPGMTSELLTWYEEGTWTPSYSGWSVDPTTAYAKYTRVGRLVTLHYVAENGTAAAASGVIGGLPFTSNAQQGASVAMKDTSFNSPGVTAFATINPNSTNIQSMTAANFAGLYWAFSTTYMV